MGHKRQVNTSKEAVYRVSLVGLWGLVDKAWKCFGASTGLTHGLSSMGFIVVLKVDFVFAKRWSGYNYLKKGIYFQEIILQMFGKMFHHKIGVSSILISMNYLNSWSRDDSLIFSDMVENGLESLRNAASFKVFPESEAYSEYGIRLMLAPRSAKARYSTKPATVHGIMKLPGSPSLDPSRTSRNWACQLGHQRGRFSPSYFCCSRDPSRTSRNWACQLGPQRGVWYNIFGLYALSGGGSLLVCLEEDGSTSFSASSASSSLSSRITVVLAFGLTGESYVKPLLVDTAFTCSFRAEGGRYALSFVGLGFGLVWVLLGSEPVEWKECPLEVGSFGFHLLVDGLANSQNSYHSSFLGILILVDLGGHRFHLFHELGIVATSAKEMVLQMGLAFMSLDQSISRALDLRATEFDFDYNRIGCAISKHSVNLNKFGDVLVRISSRTSVKLVAFDHREVMTFNGEVVSKVNRDDSSLESG
nr:hypothetical protein [Tanacetum cinerariifolium]